MTLHRSTLAATVLALLILTPLATHADGLRVQLGMGDDVVITSKTSDFGETAKLGSIFLLGS
jgi:hypothetical protein